MLPLENHLFGFTRSKPSQGSVPAGLIPASDFSFCFQYQVGSSLVLRRPIEITAVIGHVDLAVRVDTGTCYLQRSRFYKAKIKEY